MSENLLEKQLADVQAALASAKAENEAIKAQIEEAKDKEFASKVEAFEADIEAKDNSIAELEESIKSTQARVAELEDALAKSQEGLSVAMKEMEDMKKKEKSMKRKASLAEAGLEEEEVEETLASFDALDDEAFDNIVAMLKKKAMKKYADKHGDDKKEKEAEAGMPPELKEAIEKKKKEKEAKADEEEAEAEVTPELVEDLETTEAALVDQTEVADERETARASISDWLSKNVLSTK